MSLLDALLRSVPAASVPPLLTATLLTPFLTADYATSLLRERCILEVAPEDDGVKKLRQHCFSALHSACGTLMADFNTLRERRKPSREEAKSVLHFGVGTKEFQSTAPDCIRKHLRIYRRTFDTGLSLSQTIVHLPVFVSTDNTVHHAQIELSTTNEILWDNRMGDDPPEDTDGWTLDIGCRCWSVRSQEAPDRKRPRDENSARPASVWHPQGQREEYCEVNLDGTFTDCSDFEDQATGVKRQLRMLEPFVAKTDLGAVFDVPLLMETAFALSQGPHRRNGGFAPIVRYSVGEYFDYVAKAASEAGNGDRLPQ